MAAPANSGNSVSIICGQELGGSRASLTPPHFLMGRGWRNLKLSTGGYQKIITGIKIWLQLIHTFRTILITITLPLFDCCFDYLCIWNPKPTICLLPVDGMCPVSKSSYPSCTQKSRILGYIDLWTQSVSNMNFKKRNPTFRGFDEESFVAFEFPWGIGLPHNHMRTG